MVGESNSCRILPKSPGFKGARGKNRLGIEKLRPSSYPTFHYVPVQAPKGVQVPGGRRFPLELRFRLQQEDIYTTNLRGELGFESAIIPISKI
ncbi:hypothetical protein AVEN_161395-1 [Araneus ventricosus]|uniref:Uncharacterized protein n=1 Tax=Araneus ventricosus TaxID=182803 RepID=A0A4Y2FK75_ARAVE|nr:hypothetical protein AVEN_161395-1 [Araneus ventricosus]